MKYLFFLNFYISGQGGQGKIFDHSYWLNAVTSLDTCSTFVNIFMHC